MSCYLKKRILSSITACTRAFKPKRGDFSFLTVFNLKNPFKISNDSYFKPKKKGDSRDKGTFKADNTLCTVVKLIDSQKVFWPRFAR